MTVLPGSLRDATAWGPWILCAVWAVLLHGAGWIVFSHSDHVPPAIQTKKAFPLLMIEHETMRYPVAGTAKESMPYLWSPALFALPSSVGFSRTLVRARPARQPPIRMETSYTMQLPLEQVHSERKPSGPPPSYEMFDWRALSAPAPNAIAWGSRTGQEDHHAAADRRTGLQIVFHGAWTSDDFVTMHLLEDEAMKDTELWQAELYVGLDPNGSVQHVWLSQPTEHAQLNEALVRTVRGWRAGRALQPAQGRVSFMYWGAPEQGDTR
jgi:hypothetical protein